MLYILLPHCLFSPGPLSDGVSGNVLVNNELVALNKVRVPYVRCSSCSMINSLTQHEALKQSTAFLLCSLSNHLLLPSRTECLPTEPPPKMRQPWEQLGERFDVRTDTKPQCVDDKTNEKSLKTTHRFVIAERCRAATPSRHDAASGSERNQKQSSD